MNEAVVSPKVAAYRLIEDLLAAMLGSAPKASHAGLGLIEARSSQIAVSRARLDAAGTGPRYGRGAVSRSRPPLDWPRLDWASFLPRLHAGCCPLVRVASLPASPMRDFLRTVDISRILLFPVAARQSGLLGAVLIMWGGKDRPPAGFALADLVDHGTRVACQVASVLEICEHASARAAAFHPEERDQCLA